MKKITIVFFAWAAVLLILGSFSRQQPTWQNKKCDFKEYPSYYRWDSYWYTSIAKEGYTFSTEKNSSVAFFPLFPFVLKYTRYLIPLKLPWVALILNLISTYLTVWILYLLSKLDFDEKESATIAIVWLLFPASYFFVTGYPDALFSLLVVLSFYFARKKQWAGAGIASALLAITKPYGFIMAPVLFIEYLWSNQWQIKNFWKKIDWLPLTLPAITFGSFVAFNYFKFHEPLAFLIAQRTWGRTFSNPFLMLIEEARSNLFSADPILNGSHGPYLIYLLSLIFFIIAIILSWKRVRKTYILFSILVMLTALVSGTLTSWGRYMLLTVVIFMGPGLYLSKRKYLLIPYLIVSSISLLVLANLFVRCFPVE